MPTRILFLSAMLCAAAALFGGESELPGNTGQVPVQTPSPVKVTITSAPDPTIKPLMRRGAIGEYALVWADEFNGEALDLTQWDYRNETKYWSTGKETNVSVSGGHMHIALKKERQGKSDYTGGCVVSKRNFRYGYYEASIKLHAGKGWHTSFFLTAHKADITGARQQIDLCENDSIDPKLFNVYLHQWKPAHRIFDSKRVKTPDLTQDFHVWGCEFTPQKVRYYFDGDLVATIDANEMLHDDQSFWFSCYAAPLAKTMHVEDEKLPGEILVDWVRFYEKTK